MRYQPTPKTKLKKSVLPQVSPFQLANDVGGIALIAKELRALKEDVLLTAQKAVEDIDQKLQEVDEKMEYVLEIKQGPAGIDADEQKIANWVMQNIRIPKDGKDADEEGMIREVLSRLPPMPNEKAIIAKVMEQIPKPSLKVIQESIDKDALLEDILKSPKLKLKLENVEGLKKTLDVLDRRYIHGGGDTVTAGTNVTITRNSNGDKVINASGSATITVLAATGTIDDSNVTFTFTSVPTLVVINGASYASTSTIGGTLAWTNVGTTVTLAFPVGSGGAIFGL